MKSIYAFGSICRGEFDEDSDLDLLMITDERLSTKYRKQFSIYSPPRIQSLWTEGNPFAWHLYLESKFIYGTGELDFISKLGEPSSYSRFSSDYLRFQRIFSDATNSLNSNESSYLFDFSSVYLAIRNVAICYSLVKRNVAPNFSRYSAYELGDESIDIPKTVFEFLIKSRLSSTRGVDFNPGVDISEQTIKCFPAIENWFKTLERECSK